MKPLPRIGRAHYWVTKNVIIPDDGFREFRSTTDTSLDSLNIKNFSNLKNFNTNFKSNSKQIHYTESKPYSSYV